MDDAGSLPTDLSACHRLLVAAYKQSVQLERRAENAEQRVAESEQRVAELDRVLDATTASYQQLQQEHVATLDELAWYKRWAFGRRRERFTEAAGQGHLFDLGPSSANELEDPVPSPHGVEIQGYRRRRPRREIDWDKLPQIVHNHDLLEEERKCSCCRRPMDCISKDISIIM